MEKINIICVDDQPEVLDSVLRDLRPLNSCFRLEGVESASECRELLEEFDQDGELTGLIISDHVMPGGSGVELLGGITYIFQDTVLYCHNLKPVRECI